MIPRGRPAVADGLASVTRAVLARRRRTAPARSLLVAVSGVDGCGKGQVAARLTEALEALGLTVAPIGIDPWLDLPRTRFAANDPAGHFYRHAIRFDALFSRLVLPLVQQRSIRLVADVVEETSTAFQRRLYAFDDVDVIVLEGIFLLRRDLRAHHDLALWIDCTFETALERAIARAQEGLPPAETIAAYETIYFPAQRLHVERDAPRAAASLVLANDPRLARSSPADVLPRLAHEVLNRHS